MAQSNKQNIYLDANNLYIYETTNFFSTSAFKWIDLKNSELNKYEIVQKDTFSEYPILNILKSYENYTMVIY